MWHCSALLPTYTARHALCPHVAACNMQHATVLQALFHTSLDSLNIIGYSIAFLGVMGYKSGQQGLGTCSTTRCLQALSAALWLLQY